MTESSPLDPDAQRVATLLRLRKTACTVVLAELATKVAHDVGTSLSVITGRASMLGVERDDPRRALDEARRAANIIAEQAERIRAVMQRLVAELRVPVAARQHVPLRESLQEAMQVLEPLARARDITLTRNHDTQDAAPVLDGSLALQASVDLLAHAIACAESGSAIATCVDTFSLDGSAGPRVQPGLHVRLCVSYLPRSSRMGHADAQDSVLPAPPDVLRAARAVTESPLESELGLALCDVTARAHAGRLLFARDGQAHRWTLHVPVTDNELAR